MAHVVIAVGVNAEGVPMQVVILCGGQGTRIRDVADDIPKPMIPIGGRPILWHIMKGFAHFGFKDFILCLGYKSNVIKRYFLDYHLAGADVTVDLRHPGELQLHQHRCPEDWRITLAETGADAMTGARIKRISKYITSDNFFVTYGDGVSDVNCQKLLDFHHHHGKLASVTVVAPPGRFGEIETDGATVTSFAEKPLESRGLINGGYFVFRKEVLARLSDDEHLVLEHEPLLHLTDDGQLAAFKHRGFWQCMDSSRDHKYLNDLWHQGQPAWRVWEPPARLRAA
jgi:glucose-1-phosphate cytidylyltransferase